MTRIRISMTPGRFALLLALLAVALYAPTWSPVVTWAHFGEDGPELEAAGRTLGIPHPTGYPLFMLLVRVVSATLPAPWSAVNAVTLLSAVLAVIATGFAGRSLGSRVFPGDAALGWGSGLAAAAVFATSLTWWRQSTIGEVYTLHLALSAAILAVSFGNTRRKAILAAYLLGLATCHHLQAVPLLLVMLVYAFRRRPSLRDLAPAVAYLLPLSLYTTSLIRSAGEPVFDWGNPESVGGLWWMMSGTPYRGNLFAPGAGDTLVRAGNALGGILPGQLGWGNVLLAGVGGLLLLRRATREGVILVLLYAGTILVATAYAIPDAAAYFLPAVLAGGLAAGVGWGGALSLRHRLEPGTRQTALLAALTASLVGITGAQIVQVGPEADATLETAGYEYARSGVDVLDTGALVLSHGDGRTFSLWYGTTVLDPRPDVAVIYDNLLDWKWYRDQVSRNHPWVILPRPGIDREEAREFLVTRHLGDRPVYVTEVDPFLANRCRVRPQGLLYRVTPETETATYWRSQ